MPRSTGYRQAFHQGLPSRRFAASPFLEHCQRNTIPGTPQRTRQAILSSSMRNADCRLQLFRVIEHSAGCRSSKINRERTSTMLWIFGSNLLDEIIDLWFCDKTDGTTAESCSSHAST